MMKALKTAVPFISVMLVLAFIGWAVWNLMTPATEWVDPFTTLELDWTWPPDPL